MVKNNFPGKFIAIEGLDGSGKATLAAAIAGFLKQKKQVLLTCEPSGSRVGDLIRDRFSGKWQSSPDCLQLLFAADRANHLDKEIIPGLAAGISVVCDRYAASSLAYGGLDCDFDWLADINKNFILPDLMIFVDVPVDVCMKRLAAERKTDDVFEKTDILEKVISNYEKVIERLRRDGANIAVIDGRPEIETVLKGAKIAIEALY
jgi:dTMP kinase